jgi:hypothetical protein
MAGLIFFDTNQYTGIDAIYAALKSIPNFWDETDDENKTLTKGGITLEVSATQTKGIRGYGWGATTYDFDGKTVSLIAATENGLVFTNGTYAMGIGCNEDGVWAAGYGYDNSSSSSLGISTMIAPNITATTSLDLNAYESATNYQITDLLHQKGDFICADLRCVKFYSTGTKLYHGRLTMPNGEKYVKCGAFALKYT